MPYACTLRIAQVAGVTFLLNVVFRPSPRHVGLYGECSTQHNPEDQGSPSLRERIPSFPLTSRDDSLPQSPLIRALQTQDRYLVVCRDVCVQRTDNIKTTSHFVPYRHYCVLRVNGAEGRPCFTVARIAYTKLGRSNLCLIHCNVLNV